MILVSCMLSFPIFTSKLHFVFLLPNLYFLYSVLIYFNESHILTRLVFFDYYTNFEYFLWLCELSLFQSCSYKIEFFDYYTNFEYFLWLCELSLFQSCSYKIEHRITIWYCFISSCDINQP
jgi:hypothetical protein